MDITDILLVVGTAVMLYLVLWNKYRNRLDMAISTTVSVLLLIVHFVFGVVRWQFYLLYAALPILIALLVLAHVKGFQPIRPVKRLIHTLLVLAVLLSFSTALAFPIYELPKPSGEYDIGTESFVIEDDTREELYGDSEYRRFMIQIWYPAETADGYDVAPWLEGGRPLARALAQDNWLPAFALEHLTKTPSNSYYDAPINEDETSYPIVIISHGWRGFRTLHTDFAEELASLGYLVVSIDHTYGSLATVFSEEDVAYLNLDALPPRDTNPDFLADAHQLVYTYSGDIIATLDYLETLNDDDTSRFHGRLNLDTIGLLGHSTGGGAGVATALVDDRIDAVFGLDSWVEPIGHSDLSEGLDVPSLFVRSGAWETGENNAYLYNLIENSSDPTNLYQINGTTHYDFAMVYMISPLTKTIGFSGSLDSEYLTDILKTMIADFFEINLIGSTPGSIDTSLWEEVTSIPIP